VTSQVCSLRSSVITSRGLPAQLPFP
jgi:hypothetical protein